MVVDHYYRPGFKGQDTLDDLPGIDGGRRKGSRKHLLHGQDMVLGVKEDAIDGLHIVVFSKQGFDDIVGFEGITYFLAFDCFPDHLGKAARFQVFPKL
jgi:hypothetical protein